MIDLHTHTTASDGRCSPEELVARAAAAGVSVLSVTDHDTVGGCEAATAACAESGIEFVTGIEITAVLERMDVHVLGYFVNPYAPSLLSFLAAQRESRRTRVRQMIAKLAEHGIPLDADAILQPGVDDPDKSAGRPWIARALVASGHCTDTNDAFNRWLARGRPAFVSRIGALPEEVVATIHRAGGIASLAHPGLLKRDAWIRSFTASGLDAIEAYHTKHDAETTARYVKLASDLGIRVSGGSDYHADDSHGPGAPGSVALPREDYERLVQLAAR